VAQAGTLRELCLQEKLKSREQCWDEDKAAWAEAERKTLAINPYLWFGGGSYVSLLFLPVGMVIPPITVYGILFGLTRLSMWIISGFKTS
jgi:hypothetical protein